MQFAWPKKTRSIPGNPECPGNPLAARPRHYRSHGFTLLEVMIALLVIVIGTAAVINTTTESTWKSSRLWERTIASWVAQNEIAQFRARRSWGNERNRSGVTEMANAEWQWRMQISETDDPALRRLDVEVSVSGDSDVITTLTAFIGKL